ncbi:MAG: energy transducer TonB [Nitrospira sp.]
MTTIEFDRLHAGTAVEQMRGWMASVLLHFAAGAAMLFFMMEIDKPILQESFRWDVSMVESSEQSESQPAEPVVQPPPVKPNPPIKQTKQRIAPQPLPQTHQEVMVPVESTQKIKDLVTNAEPLVEQATVESTPSQPVISQAVVAEPVESSERPLIEAPSPVETVTAPVEHRMVERLPVHHRETRADYGWLGDAVRRRIEELKRYPAQARMNHWEGKVVVAAVIRDDGEVVGVRIAETSGQALLDEEAMAVMKRASPLTLKHPLGQRHITILIPINYRLDG